MEVYLSLAIKLFTPMGLSNVRSQQCLLRKGKAIKHNQKLTPWG